MLNTIESALEDIRNGKMVIVVDDEDRENEGDFIISAEHCTKSIFNSFNNLFLIDEKTCLESVDNKEV